MELVTAVRSSVPLPPNKMPSAGNVPGDQKAFVLNRRLRNRIISYMRRFRLTPVPLRNSPESNEFSLLSTTAISEIACFKKYLAQCYEQILSKRDPHRGLFHMMNKNLIVHREKTNSLDEIQSMRQRTIELSGSFATVLPSMVDNLRGIITKIEADFKEKAYYREFEIYLIQLGTARSKLYELDSLLCEHLCRVLIKSTKIVERMLSAQSSTTPHRLFPDSNLKSYAISLKAISHKYKERVSGITHLREAVKGLESEVRSLHKLKDQLLENCSDADPEDLIRRYNDLGQQKLERMENVTDAVQELIRQLAHKRNILSPKLNELDRMRSEVQDMEQRIRDRERRWGIESQQDEQLRVQHAQVIDNQMKLGEDLSRTLFEIEFFKNHMTSGLPYVSGFPDLSQDEVTAVIRRIHQLSHLLHNSNP